MGSTPIAQTAEPLGPGRVVLLTATLLWFVVTGVQLIQLIAGAIGLSRLARGAHEPSLRACELFDRCRAEIGLRPRVRLGIHPTLASPVFVGGWRSWVLVPVDWERLAPETQRAVLWHELAHAARRDDFTKLAEEAIRAVFFFHPLVHWLLNRIDAYREQVCDSAVVRRGVAGRILAQILVDFSRRSMAPGLRDTALRRALPFFRRRTVKNRIRELLEEQSVERWSAPLLRRQAVVLALIAVVIGMTFGGFGASVAGPAPPPTSANDAETKPVPAVATPTAPEKPPATTKGAATSATLDRILANWKARKDRTRSLYFTWDSRMFTGQAARDRRQGKPPAVQPTQSGHVSYWAEGPDRSRIEVVSVDRREPTRTAKWRRVWNGTTECNVEDPGVGTGPAIATFTRGQRYRRTDLTYLASNRLELAFRPADSFLLNRPSPKFRLISENALIDGRHCVEIQNANKSGQIFENCWVDPARDDVVVAYEFWVQPRYHREPSTAYSMEYRHDQADGWVPTRWTCNDGALIEATVTKLAINAPLPADTFSLDVAPGTIVFDLRTAERYRTGKHGAKSDVLQFDTAKSLEVAEVLESSSDFRIERQSLKDALEYIAARYQIPIIVLPADNEAVGIKPAVEIGPLPPGIQVADLLQRLLAKCPKTVGFRIEDEMLKISPKFAEHGSLRVRPVHLLPKTASGKERKIQETLEMPVDFIIEPQSLKDALDFIAARYHIRIESDPLMDSMIEVKGSCPGIKLRSLLSILLEQCPGQPLGFKIERDALKIAPVADKPEPGAARP